MAEIRSVVLLATPDWKSDRLLLIMNIEKVGRNAPCPCGSGKKFKQCHGEQASQQNQAGGKWIAIVIGGVLLLGALGFIKALSQRDASDAPPKVWSEEHQHYH